MDYNNNSWESGIKFVEEKREKKVLRVLGLILVVFFSASIGGIIGGYYVKKNYSESYYNQISQNKDKINNLSSKESTTYLPKNSITKVAELVGPAVVGINNNDVDFFGQESLQGSGSGIIFDKSGYIVTNEHVIENAAKITVTLSGGKSVPATLIGSDAKTDLAVLKINVENLPVAKFGDSSKVRVGDVAVAIGNPLGQEFAGSVTVGVVSALNRNIQMDDRSYKVIQTDASINPGNSGGALCNEAGEVIGINSLKIGSAEGIGFAIPINEAKPIIESLIKNGYVSRPYLGIYFQFIDEDTSKQYGVPIGVYVQKVVAQSGADDAGIRPGDIIVSAGGQELSREEALSEVLEKYKVGDTLKVKVFRNGRYKEYSIKLGDAYNR